MKELLLVYTMGKVASTTISEALLERRIECYDIHTIRKENIVNQMKRGVTINEIPHNHIGRSIDIYRRFGFSKKIKIITCVRDSFSRNVSDILQNLPKGDYTLGQLSKIIEKSDPDLPGNWMKKEFFKTTNIDLISKTFDTSSKYCLLSEGRFDVLLMRVDLKDNKKEQLISEFVGENISLTRQNDSGEKWYKDLYQNFLDKGKLSRQWVDKCVNTDYMKSFYSEDERNIFTSKAYNFVED